jgi:S-adenosylmethionine/arginine decarboxylase-like enzyme
MHLLVDLRAADETVVAKWTAGRTRAFIRKAVALTGLHAFGPLSLNETPQALVAIQMIAESHISVHLRKDKRRGFVDVFSCKTFEARDVIEAIKAAFCGRDDKAWPTIMDRGMLP